MKKLWREWGPTVIPILVFVAFQVVFVPNWRSVPDQLTGVASLPSTFAEVLEQAEEGLPMELSAARELHAADLELMPLDVREAYRDIKCDYKTCIVRLLLYQKGRDVPVLVVVETALTYEYDPWVTVAKSEEIEIREASILVTRHIDFKESRRTSIVTGVVLGIIVAGALAIVLVIIRKDPQ